jgi:hypothetical protein
VKGTYLRIVGYGRVASLKGKDDVMREFKPFTDARVPLVAILSQSLKKAIPLPSDKRFETLCESLDR